MSKKALREKPDIQLPDPVPVGHALVVLQLEEVLPLSTSQNAQDLCSQAPCRARGKVKQVKGIGSAFTATMAEGQIIELYFPMTMAGENGRPALGAGDVLTVELQNPLVGTSAFTVSQFTR